MTMASASSPRDWEEAFDRLVETICAGCIRENLTGREEIQEIVDSCQQKLTVELIQRKMFDSSSLLRQGDAQESKESGEEKHESDSTEHDEQKLPVEELATKLQKQRQQHAVLMETMRMQQRQTDVVVQQQQHLIQELQGQVNRARQEQAMSNARAPKKTNGAAAVDEEGRLANEEWRERGKEQNPKTRWGARYRAKRPKAEKAAIPPPRALCRREGCKVRPHRPGDLFCSQHKARYCRVEGCGLQSQVGGVCYRHGAKKRKRCSSVGCNNQAQNGGLCKRHGARVKMCKTEGCRRQVERGGYCVRHGAERGIVHNPKKRCVRVDAVEEGERGGDSETKNAQTEYDQTRHAMEYTQSGYAQTGHAQTEYAQTEYAQTQYAQTEYAQTEYSEGDGTGETTGQEAEEGVEEPGVGVEEELESEEEDDIANSRDVPKEFHSI